MEKQQGLIQKDQCAPAKFPVHSALYPAEPIIANAFSGIYNKFRLLRDRHLRRKGIFMLNANAPIGVMDAGLGGFTVVRELQKLLPREDIVYLGEGKYQPYGNRSEAEILHLTRQILTFLRGCGVKVVAVACNTISTLIEQYQPDFDFKIFSIVQAGADDVARLKPSEVGVLSTMFTAKTGQYARLIREKLPQTKVYAQGCPWLARIIEDGDFDQARIDTELRSTLGTLAAAHPSLSSLVLGCTHFPLVAENIRRLYPQFTQLINPAASQACMVRDYLEREKALRNDGIGSLRICTTSDPEVYRRMAGVVGLEKISSVELVPAPVPLAGQG